jgi:hypothetical protein
VKVLNLEPASPGMKWFEALSRRALAGAEKITEKVNMGELSQKQGFDAFNILVDVVFPWIDGETKDTFRDVKLGWQAQIDEQEELGREHKPVVSDLPPDEVW